MRSTFASYCGMNITCFQWLFEEIVQAYVSRILVGGGPHHRCGRFCTLHLDACLHFTFQCKCHIHQELTSCPRFIVTNYTRLQRTLRHTRWRGGVRQGCVVSPLLFRSMWEEMSGGNVNGELAWWHGAFGFGFAWWWASIGGLEVGRWHFIIWHQLACYRRTCKQICW